MLGRFTENFLITGFHKNNLVSLSTVSVEVAVRAIIGTFTKSEFNLRSSLNAFRKSFHSVYKFASLIVMCYNLLACGIVCNFM